ncbi:M4 family metallopeptidase [Nocardioides sp. CBS4Y-1]|uniref:M4 family metallopeptidase n=2 Tax=Nocardioides acrostichi TaxID=2784339 RepID=A0A930UWE0_9ACTN|nr:M4 family metallopeptidase [Nocardioides acrostichi]
MATAGSATASTRHPDAAPTKQAVGADRTNARAHGIAAARDLVAQRPTLLHASKHDGFTAAKAVTSHGLTYVPYQRTYRGLPVVGGDFVVVTDDAGTVVDTSVAQGQAVKLASVQPQLAKAVGRRTARKQVSSGSYDSPTRLVVVQQGGSHLAWETTVRGVRDGEASRLTVDVDAVTGKVVRTQEHVMEGTGSSAYAGTVTIPTSTGGSGYQMKNSNASSLVCQDASTNTTLTKSTDTWGNGSATSKETGCVDAFYAAEQERKMLSSWLGRSGMDGSGGWVPIRVGLNDVNAYYDGTQVQVGHSQSGGRWIGSIDVVAHEFGHGIDDHTPGGISGNGTQEFVADTFGAGTEWYANNATDKPDYTVGEQVDLVGSGPIRYMYKPSLAGDSNCYSSSTPTAEVHAAAGPGNHWFYLLAEGTNPTDGQPTSPTCNSTTLSGIGIQKAMTIMYNAMLMKTSSSSYLKYRTWTLTAAKNLYPNSCTEFNAVKAAWDAVSVPAQSGDPTCGGTTGGGGTGGTSCSGNKLGNPGFESGNTTWSASSGVITTDSGEAARTGSYKAWLDGYGTTHTDTLTQSVAIPTGCSATLTFYVHIDTAETTTSTAYDKLTVKVGNTTLATYSNLNKNTGFVQKSFNLSSYAGQTVTIGFTGAEDSSAATNFVIDDTALTLS